MMTRQAPSSPAVRPPGGPERALAYLYSFRRVVVGLALVGAGAAWVEQVPWLLAACVCIGVGELLESSYYIGVLRWGQRRADRSGASSSARARRTAPVSESAGKNDSMASSATVMSSGVRKAVTVLNKASSRSP